MSVGQVVFDKKTGNYPNYNVGGRADFYFLVFQELFVDFSSLPGTLFQKVLIFGELFFLEGVRKPYLVSIFWANSTILGLNIC